MGCISSRVKERSDCHQQRRNVTSKQKNNSRQQRSVLTTVQKNNSGLRRSTLTPGQEKCYDPLDKTFIIVHGDDELDFECDNFKSPRAKMPCGHAVTPMSLTNWCRRQLDEGKRTFVCGVCDDEWSYEEVCKMALLTPKEREEFEKKMFRNAARDMDVRACPGCKSRAMRNNLEDLSVVCTMCTASKHRTYRFCWQCSREWKGPAPRSDHCENDGCINQPLETLRNCPDIVFETVSNVTGCPSIRACPICSLLVEHDKTKCKNVVCQRCEVEFCFVCLKITEECKKIKPYDYFNVCSTGVAPRQTTIPVWERK